MLKKLHLLFVLSFYTNYKFRSNQFLQKSIFYVEGKGSEKELLRLRQLEQAKHENGSSSMQAEPSQNSIIA